LRPGALRRQRGDMGKAIARLVIPLRIDQKTGFLQ
jgi:hypothetical protein